MKYGSSSQEIFVLKQLLFSVPRVGSHLNRSYVFDDILSQAIIKFKKEYGVHPINAETNEAFWTALSQRVHPTLIESVAFHSPMHFVLQRKNNRGRYLETIFQPIASIEDLIKAKYEGCKNLAATIIPPLAAKDILAVSELEAVDPTLLSVNWRHESSFDYQPKPNPRYKDRKIVGYDVGLLQLSTNFFAKPPFTDGLPQAFTSRQYNEAFASFAQQAFGSLFDKPPSGYQKFISLFNKDLILTAIPFKI